MRIEAERIFQPDGSATIRSNDGFFALARQFTELPKGTPTAPPLPHAVRVDLAVAIEDARDDEEFEFDRDDLENVVDEFATDLPQLAAWQRQA